NDDAPGTNHGLVADSDARQDRDAIANPDAVTNHHRASLRHARVIDDIVEVVVENDRMGSDVAVRSDSHMPRGADVRTIVHQCAIADFEKPAGKSGEHGVHIVRLQLNALADANGAAILYKDLARHARPTADRVARAQPEPRTKPVSEFGGS